MIPIDLNKLKPNIPVRLITFLNYHRFLVEKSQFNPLI